MTRRFPTLSVALALTAACAAAGCSPPPAPRENPVDAAMRASGPALHSPSRAEGHRVFVAYCAPCHGDDGRGDGQNASRLTPRPPDLQAAPGRLSAADIQHIVERGTAAAGRTPLCPPLGRALGADSVEAVVAYVRTLGANGRSAAR